MKSLLIGTRNKHKGMQTQGGRSNALLMYKLRSSLGMTGKGRA